MPDLKLQLDYGHAVPVWKRPRVRRWSIGIAIVAVVSVIALEWGEPAYSRCRFYYLQRQCLNYTAPADEIVYDDEPVEAAKLLNNRDGYRILSANASSVAVAQRPLETWIKYSGERDFDPVLFLHERATGGVRRLICIRLLTNWNRIRLQGLVHAPLSLFPESNEQFLITAKDYDQYWGYDGPAMLWLKGNPQGEHIRFYPGQPDPADESHFTIVYEMSGRKGTIDGWLQQPVTSPDAVKLTVRDGPAKPPPGPRKGLFVAF